MRIHALPESVVNRIAAGEVVERPASVLKELLENSLDAGADMVEVSFTSGGLGTIEVRDNGSGMTLDEIEAALQRYTTSKIRTYEDLMSVNSFGFRGEALSSIASVSRLEIMSFSPEYNEGGRVSVEGGAWGVKVSWTGSGGTVVRVNDLFFNTPARKKFLKTPRVERSHLINTFWYSAIPCEGVSFTLYEGDKEIARVPGELSLKGRVVARERNMEDDLVEFSGVSPYFIVKGFLGKPSRTYPTSSHVKVFVNRRPVREPVVMSAVKEGLRGYIPDRRYPCAYLFIEVSPEEVDFNVHPSKREVKFRYVKELFEIVRYSVKNALVKSSPVGKPVMERQQGVRELDEERGPYITRKWEGMDVWSDGRKEFPEREKPRLFGPQEADRIPLPGPDRRVSFVGQILGNYLLFEGDERLIVVDFHAASERLRYNEIEENMKDSLKRSEPFLISLNISLERLSGCEEEVREALVGMGCETEILGGSLVIRAIPEYLRGVDMEGAVMELVEVLGLEWGERRGEEERIHRIISTFACHAALRGEERISRIEAESILGELSKAKYADTCPHGRPVYIVLSKKDFHRMFGRS